jgi:hypothetical protein
MLERLHNVNWDGIPQPPWNQPDDVPQALQAVATATGDNASKIYSRLLFALGNNHAGTYYPVALWVIPFLGEVLRHGSAVSKEIVLDALVDLAGSFAPEPVFQTCLGPSGLEVDLHAAVTSAVAQLRVDVEQCRGPATKGSRVDTLASDLLDLLEECSKQCAG